MPAISFRLRSSGTPFGCTTRFTLTYRDVEDLLAERIVRSVARATTLNKEAATQALESAQPDFAEA